MKLKMVVLLIVILLVITLYDNKNKISSAKMEFRPNVESAILKFIPSIEKALDMLKKDKKVVHKQLSKSKYRREILSIGFPEAIRWNEFQDMIEIAIDETLYVKKGSDCADFSIGYFQMKPSFVENLEKYVVEYELFKSNPESKEIILNDKTESKNRLNRINRLNSLEWQLVYLQIYWVVANHKFRDLIFSNEEERLSFYASAYNFGFTRPVTEIKKWQKNYLFPYGKNYKGQQMAYADISMYFLKKYSYQFFN